MPTSTCAFYGLVAVVAVAPWVYVWLIWHDARTQDWFYLRPDTRDAYVDIAKTLVTASGIAVGLLASFGVVSARAASPASPLVAFSAKVAAVSLILCVCLSLVVILLLVRFFDRAWSRRNDEMLGAGQGPAVDGKLSRVELLLILVFSGAGLCCFGVGFAFLGRIAFHF